MATEIGGETYYTVEDLAAKFEVSPATVYTYIRSGKLPASRFGKRYQIASSHLTSFLKQSVSVLLVFSLLTGSLGQAPAVFAQSFRPAGGFSGGPGGVPFLYTPVAANVGNAFSAFSGWLKSEAGQSLAGGDALLSRIASTDFTTLANRAALSPLIAKLAPSTLQALQDAAALDEAGLRRLASDLKSAVEAAASDVEARASELATPETIKALSSADAASNYTAQLEALTLYGGSVAKSRDAVRARLSELRVAGAAKDAKKLDLKTAFVWSDEGIRIVHPVDTGADTDHPSFEGRVTLDTYEYGITSRKAVPASLGNSGPHGTDAGITAKVFPPGAGATDSELMAKGLPEPTEPSLVQKALGKFAAWRDAREDKRIHKVAFNVYAVNALSAAQDEKTLWSAADRAVDGLLARVSQVERSLDRGDRGAAAAWIEDAEQHLARFQIEMKAAKEKIGVSKPELSRYHEEYWVADSDMRGNSYVEGAPKYSVLRSIPGDEAGARKIEQKLEALKERMARIDSPYAFLTGAKPHGISFLKMALDRMVSPSADARVRRIYADLAGVKRPSVLNQLKETLVLGGVLLGMIAFGQVIAELPAWASCTIAAGLTAAAAIVSFASTPKRIFPEARPALDAKAALKAAQNRLYSVAGGSADSMRSDAARLTSAQRLEYFRSPEFKTWVAAEKAQGRRVFWLKDLDKTQGSGDVFTFFFDWRARNGMFTDEQNDVLKSFLGSRPQLAHLADQIGKNDGAANARIVIDMWLAHEKTRADTGVDLKAFWMELYWAAQKGMTREEKRAQAQAFAPEYAARIFPGVTEENKALAKAGAEVFILSNGDQDLVEAVAPMLSADPKLAFGAKTRYRAGKADGTLKTYELFSAEASAIPQPAKYNGFDLWLYQNGYAGIHDPRVVIAAMDGDSAGSDSLMHYKRDIAIGNFIVDTPGEPARAKKFHRLVSVWGKETRGRYVTLTYGAPAAGSLDFAAAKAGTPTPAKPTGFDLGGVWRLASFDLVDAAGNVKPWSAGAHGVIIYAASYMAVAINSDSDPAKLLFYSGPYRLEGDTVVHDVKNASDPALKRELRRSIEMPDADHLNLVGPLGNGGKAVVRWERR